MKRLPVPSECDSLRQSLKRVKISTSPGELRIDRDVECLLAGGRWASVSTSQCNSHGSTTSRRGDRGRIPNEIFSREARLVRDPVDPLQLRLTCLLHSRTNPRPESPPNERWTFYIRMSRMYPHDPPKITRVTRDIIPNNENSALMGNAIVDKYQYSSTIVARSASPVMQQHMDPPVPQQVLILQLPPTPHHFTSSWGGISLDACKTDLNIDLATAVCATWTPVSTLQDLINFLIEIPSKRWEWWSSESNRRHYLHLKEQLDSNY